MLRISPFGPSHPFWQTVATSGTWAEADAAWTSRDRREGISQTSRRAWTPPAMRLVKVFARDQTITWSSDQALIGRQRTHHREAIDAAFDREQPAAFNPVLIGDGGSRLIEIYVPFRLAANDAELDRPVRKSRAKLLLQFSAGGSLR